MRHWVVKTRVCGFLKRISRSSLACITISDIARDTTPFNHRCTWNNDHVRFRLYHLCTVTRNTRKIFSLLNHLVHEDIYLEYLVNTNLHFWSYSRSYVGVIHSTFMCTCCFLKHSLHTTFRCVICIVLPTIPFPLSPFTPLFPDFSGLVNILSLRNTSFITIA